MKQMDAALFKRCLIGAAASLEAHCEDVNVLNVFPVPDGDTGTNMALTMKSAVEQIEKVESDQVGDVAKALGTGSLMGARGNSGVILSQLCRGIASGLKGKHCVELQDLPHIFNAATKKAYKAVMKPTEGTILTVARSISSFIDANAAQYEEIEPLLKDALSVAHHTLQETPKMLAQLAEAGVVDAGGQGLVFLLQGFIETMTGDSVQAEMETLPAFAVSVEEAHDPKKIVYSMHFLLENSRKSQESIERKVASRAVKSMVLPSGEGMKIECLTENPSDVLAMALRYGQVDQVEILRHRAGQDVVHRESAPSVEKKAESQKEMKPFGFVAVSVGEGFDTIFHQLMVDEIVSGGQTMNPSTKDLLEAVERVPAQTVFVLPNNKNIILSAQQVPELTEKNVIVIPTRSIPQAFTALFNFDVDRSPEENEQAMTESLSTIKTGEITYAVRDTQIEGLEIHTGDYMGILDGKILLVEPTPEKAVLELLSREITDEHTLLSIYAGQDVQEDEYQRLQKLLNTRYSQMDIECVEGKQPTYTYVLSIE